MYAQHNPSLIHICSAFDTQIILTHCQHISEVYPTLISCVYQIMLYIYILYVHYYVRDAYGFVWECGTKKKNYMRSIHWNCHLIIWGYIPFSDIFILYLTQTCIWQPSGKNWTSEFEAGRWSRPKCALLSGRRMRRIMALFFEKMGRKLKGTWKILKGKCRKWNKY